MSTLCSLGRLTCGAALAALLLPPAAFGEGEDDPTVPQTHLRPVIAVPEMAKVEPFTGGSSYQYAIAAPPGTGGLTPGLALRYSSLTENTEYGYGWTLNLGRIERCTRFGVPAYTSVRHDDEPGVEQDAFELDGELLLPDPTDPLRFHLKLTDRRRIVYDDQQDSWTVTSPGGVQFRYS